MWISIDDWPTATAFAATKFSGFSDISDDHDDHNKNKIAKSKLFPIDGKQRNRSTLDLGYYESVRSGKSYLHMCPIFLWLLAISIGPVCARVCCVPFAVMIIWRVRNSNSCCYWFSKRLPTGIIVINVNLANDIHAEPKKQKEKNKKNES